MSNIYIARQPIFGKNMKVFGYELLYRKSENNFFEGTDDDRATATLLDDLFFVEFNDLTGGSIGFINFSKNLLMDEIPMLLPKNNLVIEILERVDLDEEVLEKCKKFKQNGYMLAIDDFIISETNKFYQDLIEIVDIIKVDFANNPITDQMYFLKKYKGKVTFLAEQIETHQEYVAAQNLGYDLFQGFFFSKPLMVNAKSIGSFPGNILSIIGELNNPEPDFDLIAGKFETDIGLSYKLLRLVNSAYYGARYKIDSIHHALVHLGPSELIKWMNVMIIKDIQSIENNELIKVSLVRGRMLSQMCEQTGRQNQECDYFILGIFSSIDVLLSQDMESVLERLPLKDSLKSALLGEQNELRKALDAIISFEQFNIDNIEEYLKEIGLNEDKLTEIYLDALKWQKSIM